MKGLRGWGTRHHETANERVPGTVPQAPKRSRTPVVVSTSALAFRVQETEVSQNPYIISALGFESLRPSGFDTLSGSACENLNMGSAICLIENVKQGRFSSYLWPRFRGEGQFPGPSTPKSPTRAAPLKVDEVTDVPRGVERPPRDKGAVYHTSNPLSLEKDVKRGHEGQGPQKHKEPELHGFPFEAR